MSLEKPTIISGGDYQDERGLIQFVNDFDLTEIKRFYFTTHFETETIRAWQGHKIESRWFYCLSGGFKVNLIAIDNWENPSIDCPLFEYTLTAKNPQVLFIPPGYVNGFKAIKENSQLMILSNYKLNEIKDDQVRFNIDNWKNKVSW